MSEFLTNKTDANKIQESSELYSLFVDVDDASTELMSVTRLVGVLAAHCELSMVELCKYRERAEQPESEFTDKDIQNAMDHRSRVNAFRDIFRYLGQEHILMEAEERAQIIANLQLKNN